MMVTLILILRERERERSPLVVDKAHMKTKHLFMKLLLLIFCSSAQWRATCQLCLVTINVKAMQQN